jgi:hypothetical protein
MLAARGRGPPCLTPPASCGVQLLTAAAAAAVGMAQQRNRWQQQPQWAATRSSVKAHQCLAHLSHSCIPAGYNPPTIPGPHHLPPTPAPSTSTPH